MKYFWGFVLIIAGALMLGSALGYFESVDYSALWRLWPLVLIFIGLDLMTKNSPLQPVVMIAALLFSGLFAYDLVFSKNPVLSISRNNQIESQQTAVSADLPKEAKTANVEVKTGAIEFEIEGSTQKLMEGTLDSNVMRPELEVETEGNTAEAVLETKNKSDIWFGGIKNKLNLSLVRNVPLDLAISSGASSLKFDLSENMLKNLTVKAGASSIWTKLGKNVQNGARVEVDSGASSVDFEIPNEVGVRIKSSSGLSSQNFPGYKKISDDTWESENYAVAGKKINLILKTGVSSINIKSY